MKSFLIIGVGRFGRHLATKLVELGNEVMVVDKDEEKVKRVAPVATAAHVGDCQDEKVVEALGVSNFDVCFVCVRDDFQCSLEVTSMLKDAGAKYVIARADREVQIKFLKKIGADMVVHTEMDMAVRMAIRFSAKNAFEYFEFTPNYAVFEITTPRYWVGKTVLQVDVRNKFRVNIIGIKKGEDITPLMDVNHLFSAEEHLIIAGDREAGIRIMDKK